MFEMSKISSKYLLSVFAIILYYHYHYIKMLKNTLGKKNDFLNIEYFVHVEIGLKFLNLGPLGAQLIRSYYHEAPLVFPIVLF